MSGFRVPIFYGDKLTRDHPPVTVINYTKTAPTPGVLLFGPDNVMVLFWRVKKWTLTVSLQANGTVQRVPLGGFEPWSVNYNSVEDLFPRDLIPFPPEIITEEWKLANFARFPLPDNNNQAYWDSSLQELWHRFGYGGDGASVPPYFNNGNLQIITDTVTPGDLDAAFAFRADFGGPYPPQWESANGVFSWQMFGLTDPADPMFVSAWNIFPANDYTLDAIDLVYQVKAAEYFEFCNAAGQPIFNSTTGAQINDPFG